MKGSSKSPLEEATLIKAFNDVEKAKDVSRGPDAYPLLEIITGPKQGSWFTLTHQKEVSLGRANVNSIVLEDNSVSRSHAVIHELEGKFFVKDVGSRNGTFVNDKKIQEDFQLKQGDLMKVGIYTIRFLKDPTDDLPVQEEVSESSYKPDEFESQASEAHLSMEAIEKAASGKEANEVKVTEADPESIDLAISPQNELEAIEDMEVLSPPPPPVQKGGSRVLKNLSYLLVAFILLGGMGYTVYRFYVKKRLGVAQKTVQTQTENPVQENVAPQNPPVVQTVDQTPQTAPAATGPTVPVFIEVNATPLPAKILYQGKELGSTPFKTNISAPVGVPQELTAVYHFQDFNQDFSETKSFTVAQQDELIKVDFTGSLGSLNFKSLPKDVQVYLEGTFASNQLKTQASKLSDIVYNRPIGLPYGNYTLEMKKPERMEGSETVVDVVKFRREFSISKENPVYDLSLSDQDVNVFPAKIKSSPEGAQVLIDGKKVGETPYDGNLPLGKHKLTLKKEGYYDQDQELSMTMNTPFNADIPLRTSEAGNYVNKGRDMLRQGQYQQAIDQFVEALKFNPSAEEISQIQILLGNAYVKTGAFDVAIGYFEKAKANELYKGQADLGIAEASFGAGKKDIAISRVIDVILNEKNEKIKSDAESLFHKISPLKSVVLVSTDPPGAKVTLNGQEIPQPTPIVLSDLALGSYRVTIEKDGFKRFESRFQLVVSSFKPVVTKLEPLPQ